MAKHSIPKANKVSQPVGGRCWRTYKYVVTSESGTGTTGELTFHIPVTPSYATRYVCRTAAKSAFEMGFPFDPFNVIVIIRPTN